MVSLLKREPRDVEPVAEADWFDRMFDDWMWPWMRHPLAAREWMSEATIHVDEFEENGDLVVKAELPGVDPDKDIELTVTDGVLSIDAERREESKSDERGYMRRELRCGRFHRSLRLPKGVSEDDVVASYRDGILEVRLPKPGIEESKKIQITTG